jgi:DNA-binding IclR family transcriptional regulator
MTLSPGAQKVPGNGVAAVDRSLSILDAFTEDDPSLTLAELAKRTGLHKSTAIRLAESLEKYGLVRRSEKGTYRLGSKLLYLGSLYQKHFRMAEFVPNTLRQMVTELQEGASFYVRDEQYRICLHRADPSRAVRDHVHEGDRLPLTAGAAGHVILAFSGLTGQRYDAVRKNMYASSYGERDPETAAISCPVFAVNQQFAGALSVSGPKYRIEALGTKRILPVLFKHARELTGILGGDPDVFPRGNAKVTPPRGLRSTARSTIRATQKT